MPRDVLAVLDAETLLVRHPRRDGTTEHAAIALDRHDEAGLGRAADIATHLLTTELPLQPVAEVVLAPVDGALGQRLDGLGGVGETGADLRESGEHCLDSEHGVFS